MVAESNTGDPVIDSEERSRRCFVTFSAQRYSPETATGLHEDAAARSTYGNSTAAQHNGVRSDEAHAGAVGFDLLHGSIEAYLRRRGLAGATWSSSSPNDRSESPPQNAAQSSAAASSVGVDSAGERRLRAPVLMPLHVAFRNLALFIDAYDLQCELVAAVSHTVQTLLPPTRSNRGAQTRTCVAEEPTTHQSPLETNAASLPPPRVSLPFRASTSSMGLLPSLVLMLSMCRVSLQQLIAAPSIADRGADVCEMLADACSVVLRSVFVFDDAKDVRQRIRELFSSAMHIDDDDNSEAHRADDTHSTWAASIGDAANAVASIVGSEGASHSTGSVLASLTAAHVDSLFMAHRRRAVQNPPANVAAASVERPEPQPLAAQCQALQSALVGMPTHAALLRECLERQVTQHRDLTRRWRQTKVATVWLKRNHREWEAFGARAVFRAWRDVSRRERQEAQRLSVLHQTLAQAQQTADDKSRIAKQAQARLVDLQATCERERHERAREREVDKTEIFALRNKVREQAEDVERLNSRLLDVEAKLRFTSSELERREAKLKQYFHQTRASSQQLQASTVAGSSRGQGAAVLNFCDPEPLHYQQHDDDGASAEALFEGAAEMVEEFTELVAPIPSAAFSFSDVLSNPTSTHHDFFTAPRPGTPVTDEIVYDEAPHPAQQKPVDEPLHVTMTLNNFEDLVLFLAQRQRERLDGLSDLKDGIRELEKVVETSRCATVSSGSPQRRLESAKTPRLRQAVSGLLAPPAGTQSGAATPRSNTSLRATPLHSALHLDGPGAGVITPRPVQSLASVVNEVTRKLDTDGPESAAVGAPLSRRGSTVGKQSDNIARRGSSVAMTARRGSQRNFASGRLSARSDSANAPDTSSRPGSSASSPMTPASGCLRSSSRGAPAADDSAAAACELQNIKRRLCEGVLTDSQWQHDGKHPRWLQLFCLSVLLDNDTRDADVLATSASPHAISGLPLATALLFAADAQYAAHGEGAQTKYRHGRQTTAAPLAAVGSEDGKESDDASHSDDDAATRKTKREKRMRCAFRKSIVATAPLLLQQRDAVTRTADGRHEREHSGASGAANTPHHLASSALPLLSFHSELSALQAAVREVSVFHAPAFSATSRGQTTPREGAASPSNSPSLPFLPECCAAREEPARLAELRRRLREAWMRGLAAQSVGQRLALEYAASCLRRCIADDVALLSSPPRHHHQHVHSSSNSAAAKVPQSPLAASVHIRTPVPPQESAASLRNRH